MKINAQSQFIKHIEGNKFKIIICEALLNQSLYKNEDFINIFFIYCNVNLIYCHIKIYDFIFHIMKFIYLFI